MSAKTTSYPRRGFALFAVAGAVQVRTVNVTGVFDLLGSASVTESATGAAHVLPLDRVASKKTIDAKRAAFAAAISATAAGSERLNHTAPVTTAPAAVA